MITYKDIKILYEDNHVLVVVKPPDLLSQSDITGDPDLLSLLKEYIKVTENKPGNVYLALVHRLDRPVGGVMVFAKSSKAASRLSSQMRDRAFEKTYLAVVHGIPVPLKGTLKNYMAKDATKNVAFEVSSTDKRGSEAVLHYEVLESINDLSLIKINLLTGRFHQIRAQMAWAGFPVLGDRKYGKSNRNTGIKLALCAAVLAFVHPIKGVRMEFKTDEINLPMWNRKIIIS